MSSYKLICGDSAQVLKTFDAGSVDMTITSPPYDSLRSYDGYTGFDFETIAQELYRVTKPGGVVVWVVGDATVDFQESLTSFRQALYFQDIGFSVETMLYEKESITWNESSRRYKQNFEYVFCLSKGRPKTFNPIRDIKVGNKTPRRASSSRNGNKHYEMVYPNEITARGNIWRYNTGSSMGDVSDHPAPFPEALAGDHILSWSTPGDLVLDCFLGSGTSGKMAMKYGRNFVGIEVSEKYLAIAERRIHDAAQQPLLFA